MHWLHVWSSKASQRWGVTVTEPGSRFFLDYGTGEETFSDSQVVEFTRDSGKHEAVDFRVGDPATLKGLDLSDNLLYGCIPEFTEFVALESFIARGNHFTSYAPSAAFPPGLSYIDLSGNSLTQRALDQILADISARLVELPATGFVRIDGAHMPAPSVEGEIVLTRLEEKGWSTFTNDSAGWEWDIVSPAGDKSVRIGTKAGTLAWIDWAGAMDSLKSTGVPVTFSQTLAEGGMVRILVDEAKRLVSLNLAGNGFGGEVLPLNGLESLVTLDLQGNAFTGRVGSLPGSLEYLDLHSNAVSGWDSGSVPVGLTFLDMRENSLGQDSVDAILRDFAGTLPREDTGTLRLRKNAAPSVAGEGWADSLRDAGWTVEHDGDNVLSLRLATGGNREASGGHALKLSVSDPFSMSFWMKTANNQNGYIYVIGRPRGWGAGLNGGRLSFACSNAGAQYAQTRSTSLVNSGDWTHCVVTYDGSRYAAGGGIKMYINGEPDTVIVDVNNYMQNPVFEEAFRIAWTRNSDLSLDEVTIWGKELTLSEVHELSRNGKPVSPKKHSQKGSLMAWWKMGDGDTAPLIVDHSVPDGAPSTELPAVPDETGNGKDAVVAQSYLGGMSIESPAAFGGGGSSLARGSTDNRDYINAGDVFDFERTDPFTLSLWVRLDSHGGLMGRNTQYNNAILKGYLLYTASDKLVFWLSSAANNGVVVQTADPTATLGSWLHVAATYTGNGLSSGVELYINGTKHAKQTTRDNLSASVKNSGEFRIASHSASTYPPTPWCKACHVAVHTKALSEQEVAAMYNNGAPTDLRELSSASHLAAYWLAYNHIRNNLTMTSGLTQASFVEDVP